MHLKMLSVEHVSRSSRVNHAGSPFPLGSITSKGIFRVKNKQKNNNKVLHFKWGFEEGLKRRSRSVDGFTTLFFLPPLLFYFPLFLPPSLLSTFSKSIYILTPGCRGILSCCYATWMSSRMSEWWQSANIQKIMELLPIREPEEEEKHTTCKNN